MLFNFFDKGTYALDDLQFSVNALVARERSLTELLTDKKVSIE